MFLPVGIDINVGGAKRTGYSRIIETASRFDVLALEARDMTVPLTTISEDLRTNIAAGFATEGSTGTTGRWTELSPAYRQWKASKAPGVPMLVGLKRTGAKGQRPQTYKVSGQMRRELLAPLVDRTTWNIGTKRLLYTPTSGIAGWFMTGTPRMPARPPVDVSLQFLRSVDRTFVVWLNGLLERFGA